MIDSRTVVVCNINDVYITMPLKMAQANLLDRVTHHFASNGKIKIHYVTLGEGPLVLFLHGFPEYWYTWRCQMEALASEFTVAAMDLRGFNRSDSPKGVEEYAMSHLLDDVATVIKDCGQEQAIVVGHDWGGVIAWQFGVQRPDMTRKLVVLNVPHPNGFARELANNP